MRIKVFLFSILLSTPATFGIKALAPMVPLLTSDYGIVTKQDRREESRHGLPPQNGSLQPHSDYMVWQCLNLDRVTMQCEACSKDPLASPDVLTTCFVTIQIESEGALYDFSLRRVYEHSDCRATHKEWRRVLSKEKVACFSAYYEEDVSAKAHKYRRFSRWSFLSRIKTRKGNWSD